MSLSVDFGGNGYLANYPIINGSINWSASVTWGGPYTVDLKGERQGHASFKTSTGNLQQIVMEGGKIYERQVPHIKS